MPGPSIFAMFEARVTEMLLRSPTWHRFVGGIHKRYRWMKQGKSEQEMLEEHSGTNHKQEAEEGRQVLLKHFREEISNQAKDLTFWRRK